MSDARLTASFLSNNANQQSPILNLQQSKIAKSTLDNALSSPLPSDPHGSESKDRDGIDDKRYDFLPEVGRTHPFEHDSAQRHQEVARRHDARDDLEKRRHACDRADEAGKHQRGPE